MAVEVFGCTNTIIGQDYWPQFTFSGNSAPKEDRVTEIIEKIAAEVNGYVVAIGGVPADIDEADEPISFHWLQHTIGLGAAAAVGRAMSAGDPDLTKEYQRQYEMRLKDLRQNPETVLADHYDDLPSPAGAVRSHIKSLGIADGGTDETDMRPVFRMEDKL